MKAIYKIAVAAILSLVGVSALANLNDPTINNTGAYVTVGGGIRDVEHRINDRHVFPVSAPQDINMTTRRSSAVVQGGIGYGWKFDMHSYIALEANYNYTFNNKVLAIGRGADGFGNNTFYTTSNKNQAQANVILGHTFGGNYLAFVKTGYVANWLKDRIGLNTNNLLPDDPSSPGYLGNKTFFNNGALVGLGVRLPLTKNIQLAAEYDYIDYFTVKRNVSIPRVQSGGAAMPFTFKDRSYSNNVMGSLILRV